MAAAVAVTDPLADWWVHAVVIERFVSAGGGYGDGLAAAETVMGFVRDGTKLVADGTGKQVASSAQVALPISVAYVPVQSRVTLPAQFGEARRTTVIVSAFGDGGGQPTPDHHELALL
jgi:hypothetical protein